MSPDAEDKAATERAERELIRFFHRDLPTAYRLIHRHSPDRFGACLGCGFVTPKRWPCRLGRLAQRAVETYGQRARTLRPFEHEEAPL